jgi:hypothetical protein
MSVTLANSFLFLKVFEVAVLIEKKISGWNRVETHLLPNPFDQSFSLQWEQSTRP